MEQAQCDQAKRNEAIKHGLTTMIIHTRNEHSNMQANKLNAKYYLHIQHSIDTTQGNCIKDIKSNKGHKSDVLKEMHNINNKYKATKHGYKSNILKINLNIKTKVPNVSTKAQQISNRL